MIFSILKIKKKVLCYIDSCIKATLEKGLFILSILFKNLFLITLILSSVFYSSSSTGQSAPSYGGNAPSAGAGVASPQGGVVGSSTGGSITGQASGGSVQQPFAIPPPPVHSALDTAFKCNSISDRTSEMLTGLKAAFDAAEGENCSRVRNSLNNIPNIANITQVIKGNQVAHRVEAQKAMVTALLTEKNQETDTQKQIMYQGQLNRARVQLMELQAQLDAQQTAESANKMATAIGELDAFADRMISIVEDESNAQCFEGNDMSIRAISSLTSIAGIALSASPAGMGLMMASKIAQTVLSVQSKNKTSHTKLVQLSLSLRCALQNINSIHCENVRKVGLLDELERTEAEANCDTCLKLQKSHDDIQDIKTGIEEIVSLSKEAVNEKSPSRFIRKQFIPFAVEKLNNISHFLEHIDPEAFTASRLRFDQKEIKGYISKITSLNEAYQDIVKHNHANQEDEMEEAKIRFHNEFRQFTDEEFFKPGELIDFVMEYSGFHGKGGESTVVDPMNPEVAAFFRRDIINDILSLSSFASIRKPQKDNIIDSKDVSEAALKDFSNEFNRHIDNVLSNDHISPHSKNQLCISLLGFPAGIDQKKEDEIKKHCNGTAISVSDKVICFNEFVDQPQESRSCVYEDFLKSLDNPYHPRSAQFEPSKKCPIPSPSSSENEGEEETNSFLQRLSTPTKQNLGNPHFREYDGK